MLNFPETRTGGVELVQTDLETHRHALTLTQLKVHRRPPSWSLRVCARVVVLECVCAGGCMFSYTVRRGCLNNVCCLKGCSVFPLDYKMAGSGSCCDNQLLLQKHRLGGPCTAVEVTLFTMSCV